jgi:hypothetical protein
MKFNKLAQKSNDWVKLTILPARSIPGSLAAYSSPTPSKERAEPIPNPSLRPPRSDTQPQMILPTKGMGETYN